MFWEDFPLYGSDRNVEAVRERLKQRSEKGLRKYGVTTDRKDLSYLEWLQHLQDELLDGAVYVERLKNMEIARNEKLACTSNDSDDVQRSGEGSG